MVVKLKIIFGIIVSLIFLTNVSASEKIEVSFSKCNDGDSAWITMNNKEINVKFLAIDTPDKNELLGEKAILYTCQLLKNAKKIEIEYDDNSEKIDTYGRHLVWIFVDGDLLQNKIIENGLGKISQANKNYKYFKLLESSELTAKTSRFGIWQNNYDYLYYIIGGSLAIIVIIVIIANKKFRSKILIKVKKLVKKN